MHAENTFASIILDDSIQVTQIARLKRWVKLVSNQKSQGPLCRGITKLIEHDLLRYGNWPASVGVKRAFGVRWQLADVRSFIDKKIWPTNGIVASMLDLLHEGKLLLDTGRRNGRPEFIFYAAANEPEITIC